MALLVTAALATKNCLREYRFGETLISASLCFG
jgi:hypothetical protein